MCVECVRESTCTMCVCVLSSSTKDSSNSVWIVPVACAWELCTPGYVCMCVCVCALSCVCVCFECVFSMCVCVCALSCVCVCFECVFSMVCVCILYVSAGVCVAC